MHSTRAAECAALNSDLTLPCGATLTNRLAKSALSEGLGTRDGAPSDHLVRLFERWGSSGLGLLITGNVMVDRRALGEPGNVVIEDDRHHADLSRWARAATAHGAHAWVQLNHPGRQVLRGLNSEAVAPSAITVKGAPGVMRAPRELTASEIDDIIERFVRAARVVIDAGFTGVQIHGAHGYLVSQFLSPLTNHRSDAWGGSPENRRRFLLELVRGMRAELGPRTPIGVKLNSADFQRGGITEDESTDVVLALAAEGVDLLEVSGGTYEATGFMGQDVAESTRAREAYFLAYAERARSALREAGHDMPLMVTGGFRSARAMDAAVASGAVDVIGLGRPLIMEPDLPQRLLLDAEARALDVTPRPIPVKHLRGMGELLWYGVQLRRVARGGEPDPDRHPLRNLPEYMRNMAMFGRPRRGL